MWLGIVLAYDSYEWPPAGHGWPVSFFVVTIVFILYLLSGLPERRRGHAASAILAMPAALLRAVLGEPVAVVFSGFMVNAWTVASIVAVVAGVVGFFTVLRGSAFAAHAIPNGSFAGAAGASLIGVSTLLGLGVFSLAGALGIGLLGRRGRHDVATALALVMMLGLGALFLSFSEEYAPGRLLAAVRGGSRDLEQRHRPDRDPRSSLHRSQSPSSTGRLCSPRSCPRSQRPTA